MKVHKVPERPSPLSNQSNVLEVFYDGSCPICVKEIGHYKNLALNGGIKWIDISKLSRKEVTPGLTKEQALKRFHVKSPEGKLISGAAAFTEIWVLLPNYALLGCIFKLPIFRFLLEHSYLIFLTIRPFLQKVFSALK